MRSKWIILILIIFVICVKGCCRKREKKEIYTVKGVEITLDSDESLPETPTYPVKILASSPDCIMSYIPTYPDYIELDKDLVFEYPLTNLDNEIYDWGEVRVVKGTKIYWRK